MTLLNLCWSFFQVGLFSIGGGYAAIPLIRQQVVDMNAWLSMSEFTDLVTIAEMTPGPIMINAATFVGIRVCGFLGGVLATFSTIVPSLIIVTLLSKVYQKYAHTSLMQDILSSLRSAVVGLVGAATLVILSGAVTTVVAQTGAISFDYVQALIFVGAFVLIRFFKKSPIPVMVGCGAAAVVIGMLI
ncbi:MAG: chromate transporter [Christensenellales bacterium]|jgi:chromate transporter|nr:chromate transporter [Clostridiales bacterium]